MVAHTEVSLGAAPDSHVAIAVAVRGCGVGLYVSLVDGLGAKLALDYHVCLLEARLHIANLELEAICHVGLPVGVTPAARPESGAVHCEKTLVQDGGVFLHRVLGV